MEKDSFLIDAAKKFLTVLDGAIEKGPWEKTILLRATGKKLRELRFRVRTALGEKAEPDTDGPKHLADRIAERVGQLEVYVYLYNADGQSIAKWEKLILSLRAQSVSRPIYTNERDVREFIRSKPNKVNEGYAAIYINKDDIIEPVNTEPPRDKLGNPLLLAKDTAVKANNVTRFTHISGQYALKDGRLVREGDINYMDFT